jgi:hypothetical protein
MENGGVVMAESINMSIHYKLEYRKVNKRKFVATFGITIFLYMKGY